MKKIILVLLVSLSMSSCLTALVGTEVAKVVNENKKSFKDKIEVGDYFLKIPYENKNPYTKGDTVIVTAKQGKYIQYAKPQKKISKLSMEERIFRRAFTPIKSKK